MIAKKYRLSEREVGKVLRTGKPFFSYGIVLNYVKNKYDYNRFAIVIGKKSVVNNVIRTTARRRFYDSVTEYIPCKWYYDLVFVVKKQTKLEIQDSEKLQIFQKEILFLLKKIFN